MDLMQVYQAKVRELAVKYNAIFIPLQEVFDQAGERADTSFLAQ